VTTTKNHGVEREATETVIERLLRRMRGPNNVEGNNPAVLENSKTIGWKKISPRAIYAVQ